MFLIAGQKFSRYFEVHFYNILRYFKIFMSIPLFLQESLTMLSTEPCLKNTAINCKEIVQHVKDD
jgi:hypothetical protein